MGTIQTAALPNLGKATRLAVNSLGSKVNMAMDLVLRLGVAMGALVHNGRILATKGIATPDLTLGVEGTAVVGQMTTIVGVAVVVLVVAEAVGDTIVLKIIKAVTVIGTASRMIHLLRMGQVTVGKPAGLEDMKDTINKLMAKVHMHGVTKIRTTPTIQVIRAGRIKRATVSNQAMMLHQGQRHRPHLLPAWRAISTAVAEKHHHHLRRIWNLHHRPLVTSHRLHLRQPRQRALESLCCHKHWMSQVADLEELSHFTNQQLIGVSFFLCCLSLVRANWI